MLSNRQLTIMLAFFLLGIIFGIIVNSSIYLLGMFIIVLMCLLFAFLVIIFSMMVFKDSASAITSTTSKKILMYTIPIMLTITVFYYLIFETLGTSTINDLNNIVHVVIIGK